MISESQMIAMKRKRNSNYLYFDESEDGTSLSGLPYGPHAPNKSESKLMRKICSQTGLVPSQVREHKKYRQELAKASKQNTAKPYSNKHFAKRVLILRKSVSHNTGLHPLHPLFFEKFEKEWESCSYLRWRNSMTAKEALNLTFTL